MAKFGFGRRSSEDDELPEEDPTLENVQSIGEESGGGGGGERNGKLRWILIILGIGVILIGGAYLAHTLFLQAPEPPPVPPRPAAPAPPAAPPQPPIAAPAPAPAPQPPIAAPAPPAAPPAPSKAQPSAKPDAAPAPPAKAPAVPAPAKAEPAKPAPAQKATVTEPRPTEKAPAKAAFSLQVGSMVVRANAEGLKRKLDQNGYSASIREGKANVSKHVVTVGEPGTKAEAEELARRLNVDGFPSQIVAVSGKYTPQVGAFFSQDEAIDLARDLQKKNHAPKITARPTNTVVYQVRHGQFPVRSAAVKRGEELKAKGFTSAFMVIRD